MVGSNTHIENLDSAPGHNIMFFQIFETKNRPKTYQQLESKMFCFLQPILLIDWICPIIKIKIKTMPKLGKQLY
jgi:hypothetical protein